MTELSRRQVTKGAAWAAPVLAAGAAAPALAASPALTITPTSLPVGYVGEAYTQTLNAAGGTSPYSWSVTAGALPPGLSLSTGGVLTGFPVTVGRSTPTVTVTDAGTRTGSETIPVNIGTYRTVAAAEMLRLINERRASIGVATMTLDNTLSPGITAWVEGLAANGSGLVHQSPVVYAENLSAACSSAPILDDPVTIGARLTNGWLSEPHSYAEYKALIDAGQTAQARDMFYGTGAYAGVGASGHRINLENPSYSRIGLGLAYGVNGSACGSSYPYGYWGGTVQA